MPTELVIHADYQGGMKVVAGDGEHTVTMDYPLEPGQAVAGLTPLKLLLASLAGCIGNTVPMLLAKRGQPVRALEVKVTGQRRDEHPTVLTSIDVEFILHGDGLDPELVEHCIALADEKLCPVWAMIRPATAIVTSYRIEG
jgi:putative redox protein